MTAERTINELKDPSEKQLVFFYELCKAGVVEFDFSNPEHVDLFEKMGKMMQDSLNRGTSFGRSRNHAMYRLIAFQLLRRILERTKV